MVFGVSVDQYDVIRIVQHLQSQVKEVPSIGIICGSGLGGLVNTLSKAKVINYEDIDGFPRSTVEGHAGELHFGYIEDKFVVCMRGRFHYYEGYHPTQVALGVRVMAGLGIKVLVVTNAAGGVNPAYQVGDLMMIQDHICLMGMAGTGPLIGPNEAAFGPRFPPVNNTYDVRLREALAASCEKLKLFEGALHTGVYFGVAGPSYETPHEIQMMRLLRSDAVGMSTVFEVLSAAHCNLPVLGLSTITNRCKGPDDHYPNPSHAEVLAAVNGCQDHILAVVKHFVGNLDLTPFPVTQAYTALRDVRPPALSLSAVPVAAATPACNCKCNRDTSIWTSVATHVLALGLGLAAWHFLKKK